MRAAFVLAALVATLLGGCHGARCGGCCAPQTCCAPQPCCPKPCPQPCVTCTPVHIPAVTVEEQVPVFRPAFCREECVAPVYGTRTGYRLVAPPSVRVVHVPAKYECVQEKVLVCPPKQRVRCRYVTDCCGNRTEVQEICGTPAKFAVRTRKLLVCPAHDEEICIPARYEDTSCKVLLRRGAKNCVLEPAQCDTTTRTRVVCPARTEWRRTITMPAPCPCAAPCPCGCASPCAAPAPAPAIQVAPAEAPAPADAPPAGAASEAPKGEPPPAEEAKPTSRRPASSDFGIPPAVAAQRR